MKFEKEKLLTILDEALLKDRKKYDDNIAAGKKDFEKRKEDFVSKVNPKWAESVKKITAAIKAGKPILKSMLPATSNNWYANTFEYPEYKPPTYRIPVELLATRKMVELSTEDIVSTSQIKIREVEAAIRASF